MHENAVTITPTKGGRDSRESIEDYGWKERNVMAVGKREQGELRRAPGNSMPAHYDLRLCARLLLLPLGNSLIN